MINIYCDESCHMKHDGNDIMVLGSISCPESLSSSINTDIINIKKNFGFSPYAEIKWSKVSKSAETFYLELVDYFFSNQNLSFRGYVARGKNEISKNDFDDLYYKLYYRMLEFTLDLNTSDTYNLYLDKKDTIGYKKITKLKNYLNNHYHKEIVNKAQAVDSAQIALVQLTDLLIGSLSYAHRGLNTNSSKLKIIELIENKSKEKLLSTVPLSKTKVNWFIWIPDTWR